MTTSETALVSPKQAYNCLLSETITMNFELGTAMEIVPKGHFDLREQLDQDCIYPSEKWLIKYVLTAAQDIFNAVKVAIRDTEVFIQRLRDALASACREIAACKAGLIAWAEANSKPEILGIKAAFITANWTELERQLTASCA